MGRMRHHIDFSRRNSIALKLREGLRLKQFRITKVGCVLVLVDLHTCTLL